MNSPLKSVLFGMVLVVVGVLVWNVSTTFQTHERPVAFSDFMADVDSGKVEQVTITGHEIAGISRTDKERFWTYAPSQYEGLANRLMDLLHAADAPRGQRAALVRPEQGQAVVQLAEEGDL